MNTLKNPCGGSGTLGQAITSNNWYLGFEFSHLLFIFNCLTQWRYENKEKEVEKGQRKLIQRWHTLVELTKWKCHNRRLHFTYVRCKHFLTVASKVIWLVGWYSFFFKKWANPGLFFFYFRLFNTMTGFEPRISGIGSDRSANWATTTAQFLLSPS